MLDAGRQTESHRDLMSLPEPKGKIIGAVYNFADQTGQRKNQPDTNAASFSTAVTQGAASMLAQALERSGWFTIVERENVSNLIEERKIIRSVRQEYGNQGAAGNPLPPVPPLLSADVLFEGGIVSYDSSTTTGGFGVRWFGAGPFTRWQKDQVTVYVRAVSVKNGRVLQTVSATKTILSREVSAGVYKFLTPTRLLEMESGYTCNEPIQLAVLAALEKAVTALVIQGILDGNWELKYPQHIKKAIVLRYKSERDSKLASSRDSS
jgi:curli production assembly/transport component CsgG